LSRGVDEGGRQRRRHLPCRTRCRRRRSSNRSPRRCARRNCR
jgi:hypothetical protein